MSMDIDSFFDKPFDEGTLTKLELFRLYVVEWFSTFAVNTDPTLKQITIYDFFAGAGCDSNGHNGSPIIICDAIQDFLNNGSSGRNKNLKIKIHCSDSNAKNIEELKKRIANNNYIGFEQNVECCEFEVAFNKYKANLNSKHEASLLILDQFGVRNINDSIFSEIVEFQRVDFLMFFSSSFMKRFAELNITRQYFPHLTDDDIRTLKNEAPHLIHRRVLDKVFRPLIKNREYYLAPFTIQKKPNVYGVFFGSGHILGLQKFQKACWSISPDFGDANFNIDNDPNVDMTLPLFYRQFKSEKISEFESNLTSFLKSRDNITNYDVLLFGLTAGFSIKMIQKTLQAINEVTPIDIVKFDDYSPTKETYGIVDKTYQGKKKVYLKIRK